MLLYGRKFHREMSSMICQTGRPDWPEASDVTKSMYFFENIVKINFNNY